MIAALRAGYRTEKRLNLHEPWFAGKEIEYTEQCVRSTFVSTVGEFTERFERELAAKTGSPYVVITVNGTAALHLALQLAGVQRDDEVVIPALSFVATANAVAYIGAIPHFVDVEHETLGMDAKKLGEHLDAVAIRQDGVCYNKQTGRRIAAIVPMHTFGFPVDLDPLIQIARDWGLPLVEDAAESLGSTYKGKHTGLFGLLGTLSFNGNKIVTTGGGGAILTSDKEIAARAKHLSTTAKVAHPWAYVHDAVGYNYRMPNINAALGCAQLEQLDHFLECKRKLAERLADAVESVPGARVRKEPTYSRSNYWLIALELAVQSLAERDAVIAQLHQAGLGVRPTWHILSDLSMYQNCPRADLSVSTRLEQTLLNVPSSAFL